MIMIDEKLFAQINNDAFLLGSVGLQGNTFSQTIGYLNQYVNQLDSKTLPEDIHRLQQATNQLLEIEKELSALTIRPNSEKLKRLAENVVDKILALKQDQDLLLPGGWVSNSSAHAMIYQLTKDAEGNVFFHVHNSGSGLEFHEKKSSQNKELYNPVLTYKIPNNALENKAVFCSIIKKILEIQISSIHHRSNIKAADLYQGIFQQFSHLDGEIVQLNQEKPVQWYTASQISGTCAQRSLHQMLKARFRELDDYRRFIYGFKAQSLRDYHEELVKNGGINDEKFLAPFEEAIRHNLRLLNLTSEKDPEKFLFSDEQKVTELSKITAYLAEINAVRKEKTAILSTTQIIDTNITSNYTVNTSAVSKVNEPNTLDFKPEKSGEPLTIKGGKSLLDELDLLIKRCNQLDKDSQNYDLLEQLESVMNALPLPDSFDTDLLPFYQGINDESKALAFYQKMNQLQALYFSCCNKLIGQSNTTPSMYVVKLTFHTLFGHINHQHRIAVGNEKSFHDQFAMRYLYGISHGNQDTVYLANQNPLLDQRLNTIRKLYVGSYSTYTSDASCDYYDHIMDNYPSLKQDLERLYAEEYKDDKSKLKELVCGHRLTALYYFFENQNEPEFDKIKYAPLIQKFKLQKELEMGLSFYKNRLIDSYKADDTPPFSLSSYDPDVKTKSVFNANPKLFLPGENLLNTKYNQTQSRLGQVFKRSTSINNLCSNVKRTDNHTQIFPLNYADSFSDALKPAQRAEIAGTIISSETLAERELFHLRRHANMQLDLSLDYFIQNLDKLKDSDYQIYLEANFFQPGLLLDKLTSKDASKFLSRFDKFIQAGLLFYEKQGNLTQPSLALLKLKFQLNDYAYQLSPQPFSQRMTDFHNELNRYLAITKDEAIRSTLHQLRFQTLASHSQTDDRVSEHSINDLLQSHFYAKAHTNTQLLLDLDTKHRLAYQQHRVKRLLLKQHVAIHTDMLKAVLRDLKIPLKEESITITGNYPLYEVRDAAKQLLYLLNAEQGLVYKDGFAYTSLPTDIITHPALERIGLKKISNGFVSADGRTYCIEQPPIKVRFIKNTNSNQYDIQKLLLDTRGEEHYFQLIAQSPDHKKVDLLNSSVTLQTNMPEILNQRNLLFWQHCDKAELLITTTHGNEPYLRANKGESQGDGWTFVSCQGDKGLLCNYPHLENSGLTHFEDPKFISSYQGKIKRTIELDRYQLSFDVDYQTQAIEYAWQGERYQLHDKPPIAEGIPSLQLKNGDKEICIIPVQRFISTNQRQSNSEYYALTLDTNNACANEMTKADKPKLWQHTNSQKYYVFKMKDGMPVPEKPAEALYLCYLYLGANEPDKAWRMLEECDNRLGGLEGNAEELHYIEWMFNQLPFKRQHDTVDTSVVSPITVACKLKALALVTNYKNQGKTIPIPPLVEHEKNVNDTYQNTLVGQIKSFDETMNSTLYEHYNRYQTMTRDSLIRFQLSDAEKKSLLDYYHNNLPESKNGEPKAIGALGFDWVSLRLNGLTKELASLTSKTTPNAYEVQRISEINQFIQHHQGVAKKRSELEYRRINTQIPLDVSVSSSELDDGVYERASKGLRWPEGSEEQLKRAMNELLPDINENSFFKNFSAYLSIASSQSSNNQQKKQQKKNLMHFCHATLVANRHISLTNSAKNIPLLCNVLYRIIQSEKPLPNPGNSDQIDSFSKLIAYAQQLPDIEVSVPQLADNTREILKNASEILKILPKHKKTEPVLISKEIIADIHSIHLFSEVDRVSFLEKARVWRKIESTYMAGGDFTKSETIEADPLLKKEEFKLGFTKFEALQKIKEMVNEGESRIAIEDLFNTVTARKKILSNAQEELLQELLPFANLGPEDNKRNQQWRIEIAAGQRTTLDLQKLTNLYFQNSIELYQRETGLSDEKIKQLHGLIGKYVTMALTLQHAERILKQINKVQCAEPTEEQEQRIKLGQILYAENLIDPVLDPSLSVYQLYENILIRPVQEKAIQQLLTREGEEGFSESIIRVIMGGGKSKVLLPTLAYKKATGNNLTIIEVPRALLRTNFVDLKNSSSKLFGQTAIEFEFNRHSDCSAKRLEAIHQQFTDAMVNKNYLVTTNSALQSLELKYLELLHSPPEIAGKDEKVIKAEKNEWEQQVFWADKLVNLLGERGDLIIDEVHQGLSIKNKLNYTIGESSQINRLTVKNNLQLYQFFKQVELQEKDQPSLTLFDALRNNKLLPNKESYNAAFEKLTLALLHHVNSPLASITSKLNEKQIAQLHDYLNNKEGTKVPSFILNLGTDEKNKLSLYKEQISHLLPHTLQRSNSEHYGPSKSLKHPPSQRALAIPYLANNIPNEQSRFGNYLETMNFTIQSLLINGLSKDLLKSYIETLQAEARHELIELKYSNMKDTPSARQFQAIFGSDEFELDTFSLEDEAQLNRLYQRGSKNESLIYDVLEKKVLGNIQIDANILTHNAFNHVSMVRSCQGMSGTPWNHSTYHPRFSYSPKNAKGDDGLIYQAFKHNTGKVTGFDFKDASTAIPTLFDHYSDDAPLRSLIDINATFNGMGNAEIASEVAKYLLDNPKKFQQKNTIKYIIYFNEDNEITAMPLSGYPNSKPIVIGSSDVQVINDRLGCTPQERFTIYDQAHTVGVDIKQADGAKAMVLVDDKTMLSSCFQGIMRMRGLIEGSQTLDIVVPTYLAHLSVAQLTEKMEAYEESVLKEDNYVAARDALEDIIRHQVMTNIRAIEGYDAINRKHAMLMAFEKQFIEHQDDNLFEKFGGVSKKEKTRDLLEARKKALIQYYENTMNQLYIAKPAGEIKQLTFKMDKVVDKACQPGVCHEMQIVNSSRLDDSLEVEKEIKIEVEVRKEILKERFDPTLKEEEYRSWVKACITSSWMGIEWLEMKTLSQICQSTPGGKTPNFSTNIKASSNFYKTYQKQKQYLNGTLKPVHALLFQKIKGKLECTLLSQQELEEIDQNPKLFAGKEYWLGTTQHTVLAGTAPEGIQDLPEYQQIIEQVRFFNGEFSALLSGDMPLQWLQHETKEKLNFFKQCLSSNHETLQSHIDKLYLKLTSKTAVFKFITSNLAINAETFDWKKEYPLLDDYQIKEVKEFAQACHALAENWQALDLTSSQWRSRFTLPLESLGPLQGVVDELCSIKKLVALVSSDPINDAAIKIACHDVALSYDPSLDQNLSLFELARSLGTILATRQLTPSKALLNVLASDPKFSDTELEQLMQAAKTDNAILLALLKNPSPLITPQVLTALSLCEQSKETLVALVKHNDLPPELYADIFVNALQFDCSINIKRNLLKKENCDSVFLDLIKQNYDSQFSDDQLLRNLLINKNLISEPLLAKIATLTKSKAVCATLLEQKDMSEDVMRAIIQNSVFLNGIDTLNEGAYIELLNKPHLLNPGIIHSIVAATESIKVIDTVLSLDMQHNDTLQNDLIRIVLAKDVMQNIEGLTKLSTKTQNPTLLFDIANKPTIKQAPTVYGTILSKIATSPGMSIAILEEQIRQKNISLKDALIHFDSFLKANQGVLNQLVENANQCIHSELADKPKKVKEKLQNPRITEKLLALNLSLAKDDETSIQKQFSELCKVVCKQRNKLSALFFSQYHIDNTAAVYFLEKMCQNKILLKALHIDTNATPEVIREALHTKMLAASNEQEQHLPMMNANKK